MLRLAKIISKSYGPNEDIRLPTLFVCQYLSFYTNTRLPRHDHPSNPVHLRTKRTYTHPFYHDIQSALIDLITQPDNYIHHENSNNIHTFADADASDTNFLFVAWTLLVAENLSIILPMKSPMSSTTYLFERFHFPTVEWYTCRSRTLPCLQYYDHGSDLPPHQSHLSNTTTLLEPIQPPLAIPDHTNAGHYMT